MDIEKRLAELEERIRTLENAPAPAYPPPPYFPPPVYPDPAIYPPYGYPPVTCGGAGQH